MRVTKTMKEYVQKEFDKKRYAANEAYKAGYSARRKACLEEIKKLVEATRDAAALILAEYGMDTIASKRNNGNFYHHEIICLYDQYVQNDKEDKDILDHERKLANYQRERLERFYLECDLGCDKEQFFKMVEALNFDEV